MNHHEGPFPEGKPHLGEISTRWSAVHDPGGFVVRYATAIRRYLLTQLHDPHDADDVLQDFLLGVTKNGFRNVQPGHGRFRDYLFIALRNSVWKYLQRQQSRQRREGIIPSEHLTDLPTQDRAWLGTWQGCLIERALDALHRHERKTPGNLYHTAVTVALEHPDLDGPAKAAEASRRSNRAVTHDAFRQHLSRGRRLFARLLRQEVASTLNEPTPAEIDEELHTLGLMSQVQSFLE